MEREVEKLVRVAREQEAGALARVSPRRWRRDLPLPAWLFAPESSRRLVEGNGEWLAWLPAEQVTLEMCVLAARTAPDAVPAWALANERVRRAVVAAGGDLARVPRLYEHDLALQAVKSRRDWRKYVEPTAVFCAVSAERWGDLEPPPPGWSEEFCAALLVHARGAITLGRVPEKLRTQGLCEAAVARAGSELANVPQELRTAWMCEVAVGQDGVALRWVPEARRTASLCTVAVKRNGRALEWVPQELRTAALCAAAIRHNCGDALRWVPAALRTADLCAAAVAQNPAALEHVPEALRTARLCAAAVAQWGGALEYVPLALQTVELYEAAVAQSGGALEYVPPARLTAELCRAAVTRTPSAVAFVPEALRTEELWALAAARGLSLGDVPQAMRTERVCKSAAALGYAQYDMAAVPESVLTPEFCRWLVQRRPLDVLGALPEHSRTEEIYMLAVQCSPSALAKIPAAAVTFEMRLAAVAQEPRALGWALEGM